MSTHRKTLWLHFNDGISVVVHLINDSNLPRNNALMAKIKCDQGYSMFLLTSQNQIEKFLRIPRCCFGFCVFVFSLTSFHQIALQSTFYHTSNTITYSNRLSSFSHLIIGFHLEIIYYYYFVTAIAHMFPENQHPENNLQQLTK